MFPWMSVDEVEAMLPTIEAAGVSAVARSPRGFLSAYRRLRSPLRMMIEPVPDHETQNWAQRRDSFIARTLPAYDANPTHRRALALIAWAYLPRLGLLNSSSQKG
jgi:hypothetical protein